MNYVENMKELRKELGYTQKQVANLVGVSKNCYAGWEQAHRAPSLECIEKLCRIFRVTPNEFFGFEENQEVSTKLKSRLLTQESSELLERFSKLTKTNRVAISSYIDGLLEGQKINNQHS